MGPTNNLNFFSRPIGTYIKLNENLKQNHIIAYINLNDPDNDPIVHNLDLQFMRIGLTDDLISKYEKLNKSLPVSDKIPVKLNRIQENVYILQLNGTLNYQLTNYYEFLLVHDKQIVENLKIVLLVQPVHKRPPQFDRDLLSLEIGEDFKPGTTIADINCIDFQTQFSLNLRSNPNSLFAINARNQLVSTGPLYDKADSVQEVVVDAVNSYGLKTQMQIRIVVLDTNNNSPQFDRKVFRLQLDANEIFVKNFAFFSVMDNDTPKTNSKHFAGNKSGKQFEFRDEFCEKTLNFQYIGALDDQLKFLISKPNRMDRTANNVLCQIELILQKNFNTLNFNLSVSDYGDGLLTSQVEFFITMAPNRTNNLVEPQRYLKNQMNLIDLANNSFKTLKPNMNIKLSLVDVLNPSSDTSVICMKPSDQNHFTLSSCSLDPARSVYYANIEVVDPSTSNSYFKQYFVITNLTNQSEQISIINSYIDVASGLHEYRTTSKLFFNKNSSFAQFLLILAFLILSAFLFLVCCICLIIRNFASSKKKKANIKATEKSANEETNVPNHDVSLIKKIS